MSSKYDIILADPPWRYDFSKTKNRRVENHYPTMSVQEIIELRLKIAEITKDNSVLFLWATAPKLQEALCVMNEWGYTYKSHSIWLKRKMGMGYWWRGQHELLLAGVKGKFSPPTPDRRWSSIMEETRTLHSKKPEIAYEMIENMFPGAKRLELFARTKRANWDSHGLGIKTPDVSFSSGS